MKTKTLALLVAGTIVVGAGAAIAIATPASIKHNFITGLFDESLFPESKDTNGSLIGKQEGVKEPIDDSDSSPANTATDQTSVSTSNENVDSQNSSSPPQQGVAQSSPITSSTPLPTLPDLKDWADLISFRPPHDVQKSISDRALIKGLACDWDIHHIEDASGNINLDYYPIKVTTLPTVDGKRLSAEELLSKIRLNINQFVDTNISEFSPYDKEKESEKWNSPSPLTSVVHIDMRLGWGLPWGLDNPDDGSVVVSEITPHYWIFSTIFAPKDCAHPVSGNRQFGFVEQPDGSYVFYTRGADRTTRLLDKAVSSKVFGAADKLWRSFQDKTANFINTNGGTATIDPPTSDRYDWGTVQSQYHHPKTPWL